MSESINRWFSRTARLPGFGFLEVSPRRGIDALIALEELLQPRGIRLVTCCEQALLEGAPLRP